jgi:site-specific recombinase XerD
LPPRRQKRLLPAISNEQLDILVKHSPTERDKVVLNLLWYSGMRLSEAASVKARDFNWEEGTVIIWRGFCVHNVKSGLSNKVIHSLGVWESPNMVSHYAASLTFDDALKLYKVVNTNIQD